MRRQFDPWFGKFPWRRTWQPTQYSCLGNPMDKGALWARVQRVAKSQTSLKRRSTHAGAMGVNSGSKHYHPRDAWGNVIKSDLTLSTLIAHHTTHS